MPNDMTLPTINFQVSLPNWNNAKPSERVAMLMELLENGDAAFARGLLEFAENNELGLVDLHEDLPEEVRYEWRRIINGLAVGTAFILDAKEKFERFVASCISIVDSEE